ncbi:MAG: sugar phosphate nucleotidyltransferase [Candidatus Andersenbacteria bacterium]
MKAVILMAGKGTRMAKYYEGPKQLLPVLGKPILEHMLDNLPEEITEFIFVVGGPHEQTIRSHFASGEYNGRPITFVVQTEQLGLAHAFKTAKDHIDGKWVGLIADDIIDPNGIKKLVQEELAVLAYKVEDPSAFGVLVTDEDGYLVRAVEKPQEFVSDLVWTGHMVMDESFVTIDVPPSARGEYETPDVWTKLIQDQGKRIKVVECDFWLPINDKDQLEKAEAILRDRGGL